MFVVCSHTPKHIFAIPEIPMTVNGKVSESAVRSVVNGKPIKNEQSLANPECLVYFKVFGNSAIKHSQSRL